MLVSITITIFIIGYLAISLEHNLGINKAAVASAMGGLLWILIAFSPSAPHIHEELVETGAEIFEIIVFLLSAMSLVEILVHYQFFDVIRGKIYERHLHSGQQFLILMGLAFILSAVIDNLTATIVMIQIARQFFRKENLLLAGAGVVIAANAGGAFSPLGDVTTIMLWLANKFTATEIITGGFLPSVTMAIVAIAIIYPKVAKSTYENDDETILALSRSEKIVVVIVFCSFALPLLMSYLKLPPYIGLLTGLGVVWLVIDLLKYGSPRQTHLEVQIDKLIQKTDIAALKFFIGILLAVAALKNLGVLDSIAGILYGTDPSNNQIIVGNIAMGLISAIFDNVPLTAIAIEILKTPSTDLWVLLALAVGTGGSLLIIGSASGVIAMGMVKELTFGRYFRIAAIPVLAGYAAAVGVWYLQYSLFP
jgi:Na+/H+ antiporter NhaD/arsenite permease-like protein